ncbi:MAG: Mu transposase C-terminal domain-containing protein [Candidatus Desulfofervidus auxilii]|nr:Mu transposase C-terminal domain-containing protein [Candidatus Desulfofervidus auxilii]
MALAPDWGRAKRGKTKVTDEEAKILLSQLLHQNRLKIAQAIKITKYILKEKGIPSPSSPATLRRFAKSFEKAHYDIWVLAREGEKALIDKVLPHLERDADVLKTGDLLVADGHKCNFQVINPYTGKPTRPTLIAFYDWSSRDVAGYCIMVTENIQAIHLALYRAILRIGRIPTVVYLDNGKAFRAKVFTGIKDFREEGIVGLYARLGIHTIFARPYNAKAKPVERFFSTLDSFERMLPSFVGANIQDKPARLLRNEKFMQYISLNYTPTIKEAEAWFEKWLDFYRSQPSKALNGLCPKDVFRPGPGVDPKELYMLMLCEKEVKLYRNGIKLFGYWFWNEALYGLKEKVIVRYDLHDLRSVLVFTQGGEFLCEAKRLEKVHPAAAIFGDEKSYTEIKKRLSEQRKLKKLTKKLVQMGINASIDWQDVAEKVPEVIEDIDKNRAKAVKAFKAKTDDVLVIDDAEIENISLPEPADKPNRPVFKNETDKYFYLMDLKSKGETLTEEDEEFIKEYEEDPLNKAVVSLVRSQNRPSDHDEAINS